MNDLARSARTSASFKRQIQNTPSPSFEILFWGKAVAVSRAKTCSADAVPLHRRSAFTLQRIRTPQLSMSASSKGARATPSRSDAHTAMMRVYDKVLIIAGDEMMCCMLQRRLEIVGYDVIAATDMAEAATLLREEEPSLVVIDVDLAHFDGYNAFKTLRRVLSVPFILLITAEDLIAKTGDDAVELALTEYLIKPFTPQDLEVRCRQALTRLAICRQSQNPALYSSDGVANIIELGDVQIDTIKRRVYKANMVVPMTHMEYSLLELLASQGIDEPVARHTIIEELYGAVDPHEIDPRCITVHVSRLRTKLDKGLIQTCRGVGYQLKLHS